MSLSVFYYCMAQGGFSRFQKTGMIKWGQKSKPQKIPRASNKPSKIPGPKRNPQKFHAEFPSHKNFQKALNYWAWKIATLVMECLCLIIYYTIWSKNLFHIWWSFYTRWLISVWIVKARYCNSMRLARFLFTGADLGGGSRGCAPPPPPRWPPGF